MNVLSNKHILFQQELDSNTMSATTDDSAIPETDIQTLNRFPADPFTDFVKLVFQFLISPKQADETLEELDTFASSIGANASTMKNLVKPLLTFLRDAARKSLSQVQLVGNLERMGLSSEKCEVISEAWSKNFVALCKSVVSQTFKINELVDMEWKFGVTAATSDKDQVGRSFLQLKLVVDKGGETPENVHMELSLPQFYSFLHEMEKAKSSLELLS